MSNHVIVKDKVSRFSTSLFDTVQIDSDGDLKIPFGSTIVYISVIERYTEADEIEFAEKFGLSTTVVHIWAPVLVGLKPTAEMFKWVATEGQGFFYGSFMLREIEDGTFHLIFQMGLPGDELDQGELNAALIAVSSTADGNDEDLKKQFGGKRIQDL
jgi:hypothetical protein